MTKFGFIVLSAAIFALPTSSMAQYKAGDVKDGGSISGTVKFKGTAPAPKKLDVSKDKEVCGKSPKVDQSLVVNNGNLANAVVTITDIKTGKKIDAKKVTLDQKGCEYQPHVLAFPVGTTVEILNPDGILHNVHSYSKANSPFNMAQPKFKKTLDVKIDKPEAIEVKCDVHGWMQGWLVATESPYVAVTDNSGNFKLTDVPPGSYTVEVWHEKLGKNTQKVSVKAKEDAKVSFEVAGK
ncbi:MAG TPA: carboxypeptidase regulatory-like domain-containing protein [Candidatus Binatia bacterium]|nr:carboxypeptidase regulatory-like domain-containing protein [Candidatus Binatia bacterium]HEU4638433.1 carboxypeptidase regulatory-like domain-containing protein [Candidatus Binatia bacterium]